MPIFIYFISCMANTKSEGTIVGNPGKVNAIIADSDSLFYDSGSAFLQSVTYVKKQTDNSLEEFTVEIENEIDLFSIEGAFEVKGGDWESIQLEFQEFYLEGRSIIDEENIDFILSLEYLMIPLKASYSVVIEEDNYVLEMAQPDYFADIAFEELSNDFGIVEINEANDETSDLLDLAYDQIEGQSTLFEDFDENGQVNSDERDAPVATADDEEIATGNVGYTPEEDSQEESSENIDDENTVDELDDRGNDNEAYSYSTGCSDSNLTMAVFPLIFFFGRRRKSKSIKNKKTIHALPCK